MSDDIVANLVVRAHAEGEGSIVSLGTAIKGLGLAAVAAGAGIGAAVKVSSDWENTLDTIKANTGSSTAAMAQLNTQIQALGRTSPAPINDIASGFERAANMAYRGADGMKVVKAAMEAAVITGSKTADISNTLASTMRNFGIQAKDAAKTMDVLLASSQQGNIHLADFAQVFGSVGSVAKQANVSLNDAAAAMVALTRHGRDAAEASTQTRALILSLTTATGKSADKFKEMGKAAGVDLIGDMQKLREGSVPLSYVLQDLQIATGGNIAKFKELFPNIRAAQAAMVLAGSGGKDFTQILLAQGQALGTTHRLYKQQADDLDTLIGRIRNIGQEGLIAFGDRIKPAVADLAKGLTQLGDMLAQHSKDFNPILDSIGAGAQRVAQNVSGAFTSIVQTITAHQGDIRSAVAALGSAFNTAGSFGSSMLAGVESAVGSVVSYIQAHSADIKGAISGLFGGLQSVGQTVGPFFLSLASTVGHALGSVVSLIMSHQTEIRSAISGLGSVLGTIGSTIGSVLSQVGPKVQAAVGGIASWINAHTGDIQSAVDGIGHILGQIGNGLGTVGSTIQTVMGNIGGWITSHQGDIRSAVDTVKNLLGGIWSKVLDGKAEVTQALNFVVQQFDAHKSQIKSAVDWAADKLGSIGDQLMPALGAAVTYIQENAVPALHGLQSVGQTVASTIGPPLESAFNGIKQKVDALWHQSIQPFLQELASPKDQKLILTGLDNLWASFENIAGAIHNVMDATGGYDLSKTDQQNQDARRSADELAKSFRDATKDFKDFTKQIEDQIIPFNNALKPVADFLNMIQVGSNQGAVNINKFFAQFQDNHTQFITQAQVEASLVSAFQGGIQGAAQSITKSGLIGQTFGQAGSSLADALVSGFSSHQGDITSAATKAMANVKATIEVAAAGWGTAVATGARSLGTSVASALSGVKSSITASASSWGSAAGQGAAALGAAIIAKLSTVKTGAQQSLQGLPGVVSSAMSAASAAASAGSSFASAGAKIAASIAQGITSHKSEIADAITGAISSAGTMVGQAAAALGGQVAHALAGAVATMGSHVIGGVSGSGNPNTGATSYAPIGPGALGLPPGFTPPPGRPLDFSHTGIGNAVGHEDIPVPQNTAFSLPGGKNAQYQLAYMKMFPGQWGWQMDFMTPTGGFFDFEHMAKINPGFRVGGTYGGGTMVGLSGGQPGIAGVDKHYSSGAHLHFAYDQAAENYILSMLTGGGAGHGGGSAGLGSAVPAAVARWSKQIMAASKATGVPPAVIAAQIFQESSGDPTSHSYNAAEGVTDVGLLQYGPSEAAAVHGQYTYAAGPNIMTGTKFLESLIKKYGSTRTALAVYNGGPGSPNYSYADAILGRASKYGSGVGGGGLFNSTSGITPEQIQKLLAAGFPPALLHMLMGASATSSGPMFPAGETGQEFADASFGGHFVTKGGPTGAYQQFVPASPDEGRYVIRRIPVPGGGSRTVRMWVSGRVLGTDRESSAGNTAISAFGRTAPSDANTYAARTQYLSDTMGKDLTAADAASARGMSGPAQFYLAQYARLFQESQRRAKLEAQTQIDAAKAAHDWTGEISASKQVLQTDFQTALDGATVAIHDHTGGVKAFVAEAVKDQRALDRWDRAAELSGEKISLASGHYADYLGAVTQRLQTGVANKVAQVAVTLQQGGQNIAGVVAAAARQTKQLDAITESQRQAQYMVDIAAGHFSDALSSLSQRVQQLLGNAGDRMTVALASGQQITASMIAGFKAAAAASVALAEAQRKSQLIQETVTAGLEVVVGKIDDLVKAITDTAAAVRQDIIRSLVAGQGIPAQDMADLARLRQNANDVAGFNAGVDTRIALGSGTLADVGSGVSQMMTVALDNWDRALMAGAGVINQYTAQVQQAATAQRAIDVANDARNVALGELTHNLDQLNSGLSGQFNRALGDMQFVTASMGRFGDGVKSSASNLGALASQALKAAQNLGSWDAIVQGISGVKNAALDAVRLSYGRSGGTADPGAIAAYAQASQAATRATWDQVGADLAAERSTQDVIGAQQTLGDEIGLAQSKLVWLGVTAGDNSAAFQAQQEVVNNLTTEQKGLQLAIDHWTNGTQLSADEQAQATKAVQRFTSGVDPATAAAQSMASVIGTSANDTSTALNNVKTSAGGLADSFLGIGPKLAGIADSLTQVATRLANIQTPNSVTVNTSGSVNVNSGGTLADQVNNSGTGLDPVSGSGGGTPSLPSGLGSAPGLATGGTGSLPGTTSGGGNGLPGMAATHAAAHGAAHAAAKPHQAAVHKAMAAAHKALAHAHAAATHGMHHAASHAAAAASAAATAASSATFTPGIAGTAAGSATGSSIAVAGAPNVNVTGYGTNLNATNIFGDITTSGTIQLTSAYGPYGGQLPPLPSGPGAPVEGQGGFYMWNGAKWTWMPGSPPGVPALSGNGTPALQIKGTALPAPIQEPNTSYTGGSWLGQQLPDMHLPTFAEGLKNLQAAIDSNALWLQQANVELAATTFIPLATIQALQSLGAAGALWGPGPYYQSGATGANGPFTAANNWGNGPQYTPEGAILGQTPPPTQDFWWGAGKDDGRTLLDAYHMGTPAAIAGFQQAARQKPTGLFDRLQASLTSLLFSHGGQQFMMRGNALYKSLGNGQFVAVPSGSLDGIIGGPPGARFNAAGGFVHSAVSGYPSYGVSSGAIQGSTPGNPMYVTGTHDQQMLQELQKLTKHQAQQLAIQQYQIGTLKLALHGLADAGLAIRDLEASGDQYLIDNLNLAKSVNSR